MPPFTNFFSFLIFVLELVSAKEQSKASASPKSSEDGQAVTFAQCLNITWSADCQNQRKVKFNPYSQVIFWELRPHAEGIAAWREYYARLPEKCNPKPYDMAIADGKTKEEAERDQAAYVKLQELVVSDPDIVNAYLQPILTGKTPGQAYGRWVQDHRNFWGMKEWRPEFETEK